jgi:hypothetical protein
LGAFLNLIWECGVRRIRESLRESFSSVRI